MSVNLPVTLGSSETLDAELGFTPNAAGAAAGTLNVSSNDADQSLVSVSMSGEGLQVETPPPATDRGSAGVLRFLGGVGQSPGEWHGQLRRGSPERVAQHAQSGWRSDRARQDCGSLPAIARRSEPHRRQSAPAGLCHRLGGAGSGPADPSAKNHAGMRVRPGDGRCAAPQSAGPS